MKKSLIIKILLIVILIVFTSPIKTQTTNSTKYDIGFVLRGYDSSQLFEDTTSFGPYAQKVVSLIKDLSFGKISTYRIYMNGIDPRNPVYMQSIRDIETLQASLDGWPGSNWDWLRGRTDFWYIVPDFYKPIINRAIDWMKSSKKDFSSWQIETDDGKLYGNVIRDNTIRMGPSSAADYLLNLKLPIDYKIDENKVAFFALNTTGKDYIAGGGASNMLQSFGVLNSDGQPLPNLEWINGIEVNRYNCLYCATDNQTLEGVGFYFIAVHELIHTFGMYTHDLDPERKNVGYSLMSTNDAIPTALKALPAWDRYFWTKWLPKSTITTNPSEISDLKGKVSPSDTIRKYILQIVAGDDKGCGGTYKELYDGKWYKYTVDNIGTLTFTEGINNDYSGLPIIEVNPYTQTGYEGKKSRFSVVCAGNSLTYVWKKNGVIIPGENNNFYDINSDRKSDEGNYQVTISNTFGSVTSDIAKLTVNTLPSTSGLIIGETEICQGQNTVTYTALSINNATSYVWILPAGATGTSTTNSITVNYLSSAVSGNITIRGRNLYGDGDASSLAITVNPLPANAGTISGISNVCLGQNSVFYTVPAISNATSYVWTLPQGATGTSTTNNIIVDYGNSAVSGNITVNGINSCGDGAISTLAITVNSLPGTAGSISGLTSVCQSQSAVIYTVPTIANATSYIWSLPLGATGTSSSNSITVNYRISAVSGNITVNGHNVFGDGAISTSAIGVNAKPSTPIITQNGTILHSDAINGNQWYNQNGFINSATNQDYTVSVTGDYYVIVTLLGCSSDASNIINVIPTDIEVTENNKSIKIYPNPVSNELIIEIEGNNGKVNFEILNLIGQVVFKGTTTEKTVVQTSSFAPGVYVIKLENGKTFEFKKIVKE